MQRTVTRVLLLLVLAPAPAGAQCVQGPNACLEFDGVNDWARVQNPGPNALDGFGDFTLEIWFRSTPPSNYPILLSKYDYPSGGGYFFRLTPGGGVQFVIQGAANQNLSGGAGFDDGAWHHGAVARIGSALSVYVDGAVIASGASLTPLPSTVYDFVIGGHMASGSPSGFGYGGLDEVRVWNVGRTQGQLQQFKGVRLAGNESGLRGYWRLDEGGGQTFANSATATGAALNGIRGALAISAPDDPRWSFVSAPVTSCQPGAGQANAAATSLRLNGVGSPGVNGPFSVALPTSGALANTLTLTWQGPSIGALMLLIGTEQTNAAVLPCTGSLDLAVATVEIAGSFYTLPYPVNLLFFTNGAGFAQSSFTVPSQLLGAPFLTVQGAVEAPGCPSGWVLTPRFTVQ